MLKLSGKHFAMYFCGGLAFFIAMAAAIGIPGFPHKLAAYFLLAGFVLVLVWAIFCARRANASYARTVRILDEQCDPEEFLKAQQKIYRNACKIKCIRSAVSMNAVIVRTNQAVALSFAGRHSEAMDEINAILALPAKKNKDYFHGLCHINMAIFLARHGDEGDFASAREHIRKAGEHIRATGQASSTLSGEIVRAGYTVDAAEGKNPEATLEYFSKHLESASAARAEASYRYQLALICRQQGDTANERTHLESVAQTAPKAYIGKQAAARLAELPA